MSAQTPDHGPRPAATELMQSSVHPGDRLGDYRVDGVVAQSKTSIVFHATDLRNNRPVAIKVPQPSVVKDTNLADWFRRERDIGSRLDHPGIIKVIPDAGSSEDYLVMEWFDGKPLRTMLNEQKRLSPERAVAIAVEICNTLEYLHSQGIVHRDLQPENILVGPGDRIKLIDFGGAAKTQARRLTFTKVAQLTGASAYISPEELLGKQGDARSDIFALGMILYEMLTGQNPFPQPDLYERLSRYPIPPREIDSAISPHLQEVIYRALERKPNNRYANAHEFATDLTHLDQVGVADRPELRDWKKLRSSAIGKILLYASLVLVPVALFALLLYFARH